MKTKNGLKFPKLSFISFGSPPDFKLSNTNIKQNNDNEMKIFSKEHIDIQNAYRKALRKVGATAVNFSKELFVSTICSHN